MKYVTTVFLTCGHSETFKQTNGDCPGPGDEYYCGECRVTVDVEKGTRRGS